MGVDGDDEQHAEQDSAPHDRPATGRWRMVMKIHGKLPYYGLVKKVFVPRTRQRPQVARVSTLPLL